MNKSNEMALPVALGIADALFTKVQQRVLAVLYGNVGRSFFANELIRLAASGSGAVQRELARLEGAGLIEAERLGRQKYYRANRKSPVFEELRGLVLKTSGLADQLRSALVPRADDIRAAFVFGSVAKRTDSAASDIDVMVISDELAYAELFSLIETASVSLGRTVSPTLYTVTEFATRREKHNAFLTRVMEQPRLWIIGSERDLAT